jgi:hypothetical protein
MRFAILLAFSTMRFPASSKGFAGTTPKSAEITIGSEITCIKNSLDAPSFARLQAYRMFLSITVSRLPARLRVAGSVYPATATRIFLNF